MKNSILLTLCVISVLCSGCHRVNPLTARTNILKKYPNADVTPFPDYVYKFVVRDTNGAVYFVECLNSGDDLISAESMIFPSINR